MANRGHFHPDNTGNTEQGEKIKQNKKRKEKIHRRQAVIAPRAFPPQFISSVRFNVQSCPHLPALALLSPDSPMSFHWVTWRMLQGLARRVKLSGNGFQKKKLSPDIRHGTVTRCGLRDRCFPLVPFAQVRTGDASVEKRVKDFFWWLGDVLHL